MECSFCTSEYQINKPNRVIKCLSALDPHHTAEAGLSLAIGTSSWRRFTKSSDLAPKLGYEFPVLAWGLFNGLGLDLYYPPTKSVYQFGARSFLGEELK